MNKAEYFKNAKYWGGIYGISALITYALIVPVTFNWVLHRQSYDSLYVLFMLVVVPIVMTVLAAVLGSGILDRWAKSFWPAMAASVLVTFAKWVYWFGLVVLSMPFLPAPVLDQIAPGFYYWMIPLTGIEWIALLMNAFFTWRAHRRLRDPFVGAVCSTGLQCLILGAVPVMFGVSQLVYFVGYRMITI